MKNSKRRNASIYLISFAILLGLAIACYLFLAPRIRAYRKDMIGIRMMEKLGAGFNIGNDLDAYGVTAHKSAPTVEDFETYWHNVPATKELFAAIRAAGFSSVRIPVSWSEHTDADGTIDPAWMERVREVVDQALAEGLYVILDTHHELFIIPDKEHAQASEEGLRSLWRQIAPRFADCDEHLLFEGMNEPRMRDTDEEWTDGTSELRDVVNQLNAAFIETVREAGGNNATRFLLIPAYATSCKSRALEELEMPEDHRVLASVHAYLPHSFTDADRGNESWSEEISDDTEEILKLREDLQTYFLDKHIGVVITEFGCEERTDNASRLDWAEYYVTSFSKLGVPCFWWDNGDEYRIIDRVSCTVTAPELVRVLTTGKASGSGDG